MPAYKTTAYQTERLNMKERLKRATNDKAYALSKFTSDVRASDFSDISVNPGLFNRHTDTISDTIKVFDLPPDLHH